MDNNPFSWIERRLNPRTARISGQTQHSSLTHPDIARVDDFHNSNQETIRNELLRQARWSFNFAIFMMAASSVISIAGIGLLLSGKVREGAVTAAGGLASYIVPANCLRLAEKSNDRLNKMLREPKQEQ
jgi:hypothetical protein